METVGTRKGPALTYIKGDREPVRNGCNFDAATHTRCLTPLKENATSALGQKRTFKRLHPMSALTRKQTSQLDGITFDAIFLATSPLTGWQVLYAIPAECADLSLLYEAQIADDGEQ